MHQPPVRPYGPVKEAALMHDISFLDRGIRLVLAGDAGDLAAERALDPVVAEELKGHNPVVGDAA